MSGVRYRRRGTAIVETKRGILLTAGHHGAFILPGGGAKRGESRFVAALRELTEETTLRPYFGQIIFRHVGGVNRSFSGKSLFQDHHTVCLIKASGTVRPHDDAKRIAYWNPGCDVAISHTTREIIDKYLAWKRNQVLVEEPAIDEDDGTEDAEDGSDDDYDSNE